ncbi:MAG: phosphate ABC transporter permease subunit PstC [Holophaga sp.]|nr:phosphate ABC transporter permease subunit PstC [Holophaga sp.]
MDLPSVEKPAPLPSGLAAAAEPLAPAQPAAGLSQPAEPAAEPEKNLKNEFPRRSTGHFADRIFRLTTGACALVVAGLILVAIVFMVHGSIPAFKDHGLGAILSPEWDPTNQKYGALTFLFGTAYTSVIGMVIALPLGVLTAVALVEILPQGLAKVISLAVELLAAIPSVLLGLWGIFTLVPLVRSFEVYIYKSPLGLNKLPIFSGSPMGVGFLAAGLLLAVMALPFILSVTREVLLQVPTAQREAAYALGATRWQAISKFIIPYSWKGIFGAGLLGFARVLGETMAVTMVIGNTPQIKASLFASGYTLASVIANEFTEAPSNLAISALISLGLILLVVSIILNGAARLMLIYLGRSTGSPQGAK